ncbi:MAG: hypothetical protein ACN4GW_04110 [Desulforhopalus sp.]
MALNFPQFTRRNLIVTACCFGLSVVMIVLGPVLQLHQKTSLDKNIVESRKRVELLGRAAEMRQLLEQRISGLQAENTPESIKVTHLASGQADQVLADLRELADEVGVQLAEVKPDLKAMGQNSKSMQIKATVYGSMTGFQELLNSLLQMPYVERLQRLLVSAEPEGLQLETEFSVHIR